MTPIEQGYQHPTSLVEFEAVYRKEYEQELESCERWTKWCDKESDPYGQNFHQGRRSALVFNNIKMEQLLRILKQHEPNISTHTRSLEDENKRLREALRTCFTYGTESMPPKVYKQLCQTLEALTKPT